MSVYQVWCEDRNEERCDAVKIETQDAHDAATEWARRSDWNDGDYSIANGREVTVCVSIDGFNTIDTFTVVGEAVPHYVATKMKKAQP